MKTIILSLTLLFFMTKSFSQSPAFFKNYYLQKSRNQKTVAWVLLGSGLGIEAAGGLVQLIYDKQHNDFLDFDFTGAYIAMAGGVVGLSSIHFFISSAKNTRKARSLTLSNQKIFLPQQGTIVLMSQTTVSLKIHL